MAEGGIEVSEITPEQAQYCASEPIHLLAAVQPHGFILVVDLKSEKVIQYSENMVSLLQLETRHQHRNEKSLSPIILGSNYRHWVELSQTQLDALPMFKNQKMEIKTNKGTRILSQTWDCIGHRTQQALILEFCAKGDWIQTKCNSLVQNLDAMAQELKASQDVRSLLSKVSQHFQTVTGYDRVMAYRFLPDGSGEVITEAVSERENIKFLNMRFPAEDIPPQAKALYLKNRLRIFANTNAKASPLIPSILPDGSALDMSYCLLRSVSNMHRIYLKNMGVKATVAISLVVEGKLWGLLVFHHNDPRLPPNHMVYELRIGCDFVSDILSMYLSPTLNNETIRTVEKHQRKIEKVVRLLAANPFSETTYPKLLQNIQAHLPYDFIGFCNAEHCFICESGQFKCLGPETITSIKSLFSNVRSNYLARHDLIESQEQITHLENMAGIAVMRSPILTDLVAFFGRVEIEKTVSWGGKPKTVTIKTINNQRILEPRSSFARWRQNLKGQCDFWEDIDFKVLSFCFEQIKDFIAAKRDEQHLLQLQKNTHYDLLTGLPNRALLANFIEALRSKVEDAYITLFFIDLDNFKQINDFRGHEVGDLLLIKIAERLRMCVRPDDLVVRLGGDEFVIVLVNAASPTTREIASISKKIIEVISSPVIFGEFTSVATASVGIVNSEVHLVELNEALKQADIAMYCAKNNGKNQFSIFKQKQQDAFNRRVVLFDSLRQAIDKNKLRTYFQPQFNASKKLVGVEALARWDHETFGPISPEVFIEVAEQNSLIYQLGLQLFQSACQSLKLWQECQLIKSFQTMSINISPSQLSNPNFINDVLSITNTLQINPRCIRLEITESVFMKYFDVCMDSMSALREKGFSASLDDFGTGYSSLNYLWRLPIDEVKIDQSFVKHMLDNESLITMVSSMIDMCHRLNLTVVAEGVEKDEEYQLLSKLGCDIYQGYFFSKPVSDAECLEALLFIES